MKTKSNQRFWPACVLGGLMTLWGAGPGAGQDGPPRITHVHPMGGQKGETLEVSVTGQFLHDAESLHFNFPGAKAEPVGDAEKLAPKGDPKGKRGMGAPGAQTTQRFKVTLPANAPLGIQDVRVVTKGGLSNPRAFVIGDLKEVLEKEGNDDVGQAQKVEMNSTVNGVVLTPTDVDYYQFTGVKGQRVVISCLTTSIDSRLPAQIQVYGSGGNYLGLGRAYWSNDAVMDVTVPADGDYLVRLCSFTYTQGGPDYFYRLTITTGPWIDAVFPVAVEPGKDTKVTIWGRNLPGGTMDPAAQVDGRVLEKTTVTVKAPADPQKLQRLEYSGLNLPMASSLDGMELRVKNEAGFSNPMLLTYASSPVVQDAGDNDTREKAQKIALPSEVSGRFEKKGDRDWYNFTLKKGETIHIDALGERLGSVHDLFFQISDEAGKTFPEQDENPEITSNLFYTRNEDPAPYKFTAPADGDYTLMISSREAFSLAGPRHYYLARINKGEPNFQVVAMPATTTSTPEGMTLSQGGHQAWSVFVFREGGFNGDITLTGESLPPGVSMPPHTIAFGQKSGAFVLSAAPEAPPSVSGVKIVGTATVGGKKIVREVRGSSITWPGIQNQVTVLVSRLDRELVLAVRGQAPFTLAADKPAITVNPGEKVSIPIKFTPIATGFKSQVNVAVLNPPPGLVSQNLALTFDKKSGELTLDSKTPAAPGVYSLVLRGQTAPIGKAPPPKGPAAPNLVEYAPPVTLTIVPKQLGKMTIDKGPKLSPGGKAEVTVRFERQFDFPGELKVEIISDKNEITAAPAVIKEGGTQVSVPISLASNAKVGTNVAVTIRATAMFYGTAVIHELKGYNLAVSK